MDYISRHAERRIQDAMRDTPVIVINGPRQSGKSTLVQHLATSSWDYFTLDDPNTLNAAREDPIGLLAHTKDHVVIDEVQLAPELLRAVKLMVDRDRRPGRFLITGSANLLTVPRISDSLAGRSEVITLLPFSQAEIRSTEPSFLNLAFTGELASPKEHINTDALLSMILRGGFPEARKRRDVRRVQAWCRAYLNALIQRDISHVADIRRASELPRLVSALAHYSGKLVNHSAIAQSTTLDTKTAINYANALERIYLISRVPAWHEHHVKRIVKTPKLHFMDTALLSTLLGASADSLRKDRDMLGHLLETFAFTEIVKQAEWNESPIRLSHYRDKDKMEVDLVLENPQSEVVGIEVKAGATVNTSDFNGLRKLSAATGERFRCGIVLFTGERPTSFGERMFAMPLASLWS